MNPAHPLDRTAQLATGAAVPLREAALHYSALLDFAAVRDDGEWDLLHLLRRACLGEPLDPGQRHALAREGLLDGEGGVNPVLRQVVLASVRGQDRGLYVDCPFVTALDRAVAEFEHSRQVIRTGVDDPQVATTYLTTDPLQDRLEAWRRHLRRNPPPDTSPPL
jgi:hypothetical protein